MTGLEVFNMALDLCGLRKDDRNLPSDTADLQARALNLLNITLAEVSALDCRIRKAKHEVLTVETVLDKLGCSDVIANSVLPYGLARLMMLGEDDSLAADFNKLYITAQKDALKFGNAKTHSIEEVYS